MVSDYPQRRLLYAGNVYNTVLKDLCRSYFRSYGTYGAMPFRNQRGGWRVKRNLGVVHGVNIGRINLSLGTHHMSEAANIERMIDDLATDNFSDCGAAWLLEMARKRRAPIDVYRHHWKPHKMREGVPIIRDDLLTEVWKVFVSTGRKKNGTALSERTRNDYSDYVKRITAAKPTATVSDLPALLEEYRSRCVESGKFATFNKVRAACLTFARNTEEQRQFSELWRAIKRVDPTPTRRKKKPSALPFYEVREVIERLPQQRMRNAAWMLALTGMRVGELAGEFAIVDGMVVIKGTKSANAERYVPLLSDNLRPEAFSYFQRGRNKVEPTKPPLEYTRFRKALRAASGGRLTPHDFRHCYKYWLTDARIHPDQIRAYMGWAEKDLDDRYGRPRLDAEMLAADTNAISQYLRTNSKRPKKVRENAVKRFRLPASTNVGMPRNT